mmetsp:Transcript_42249/g.111613  ORF Transcript_42249/g.111613 Transcript_42249/m.111613 type:complete len:224 (+) Transcript_42249:196-867(+)
MEGNLTQRSIHRFPAQVALGRLWTRSPALCKIRSPHPPAKKVPTMHRPMRTERRAPSKPARRQSRRQCPRMTKLRSSRGPRQEDFESQILHRTAEKLKHVKHWRWNAAKRQHDASALRCACQQTENQNPQKRFLNRVSSTVEIRAFCSRGAWTSCPYRLDWMATASLHWPMRLGSQHPKGVPSLPAPYCWSFDLTTKKPASSKHSWTQRSLAPTMCGPESHIR